MEEIKAIYLKDYKKPKFAIKSVDLVFELYDEYTLVTNTMEFEKLDKDSSSLVLDTNELELLELWINDLKLKSTRYIINDETLEVLNVPQTFTLKVHNKIYPHKNTEL